MTPALPDDFIDLLERLTEGELDEAGREDLRAMLQAHPELRQVVREHFALARGLADLNAVDEEAFAARTATHIAKIAAEGEGDFAAKVVGRIVRRRIATALAAAAVLALAANFAWRMTHTAAVHPALPEIAELIRIGPDNQVISTGPVHAGERFSETSGLLRLEFDNGALIAIEAPAELRVISDREVALDSGRLNGWCPESAHGFKVTTATGSLTDLGTSFGIRVDSGQSEFVVLDGLVEVEKGQQKVQLAEGNAVAADPSSPLNKVAFAPSDFRKTWALTYGILATRGAAVPPNPDLLEKLVDREDDRNLLVIPERRQVPFDYPIHAEVTHPGTMPGDPDAPRADDMNGDVHTLQPIPGKKLSSVIIRFNPVGIVPEEHFKRIEGEVTFDRPVLAIAGQQGPLEDGDAMFATGRWNKGFRGMELRQYFNPPDSVTLSADRRTVRVVFYTGASTDDVRVILEDN